MEEKFKLMQMEAQELRELVNKRATEIEFLQEQLSKRGIFKLFSTIPHKIRKCLKIHFYTECAFPHICLEADEEVASSETSEELVPMEVAGMISRLSIHVFPFVWEYLKDSQIAIYLVVSTT